MNTPLASSATHHDAPHITVRLIRWGDGTSSITCIANAHPWVLRRAFLTAEDVA